MLSQSQMMIMLVVLAVVAVSLIPTAQAFGAGNVPSFSAAEGSCFRHGDLEDILAQLLKKAGGSLFGRGSKFGGLDVKRVYFGNWLRDYSQAMDVASLSKTSKQTILNLVMVLGFLAHGYATGEFEVTSERLGVYLPTEHIDNPKGYAEGQDAKKYDSRLRGPVDPRELEVDPRTGMKNYIANEDGHWDTSSALVRRTFIRCIEIGRKARASHDEKTLYEAYRLLGQSLHTMEDFTAHSNWCELALIRIGHHQVFTHVGDNVKVRAPDGTMIAPIVTGTFGGADFMHSMLGEAQDHLSQASVSDLYGAVEKAKAKSNNNNNPLGNLMGLLKNVPGASSNHMTRDAEDLSRGPTQDVSTMSPQDIYKNLFRILAFRDNLMMWIEETIEKIPGLSSLLEKISNAVSVFVFTLIEPYVQPLMKQALGGLKMGSSQVINQEDQFEVFNNPNASDPTHSMLSKDHFGLVLNELAGKVAIVIVRHCVTLIVKAWDDEKMDSAKVADECLAPIFHPFWFHQQHCHPVQYQMLELVKEWASTNRNAIGKLDRQHVRSHMNTRSGKAEPHDHGNNSNQYGNVQVQGQQGYGMGTSMAHNVQTYVGGKIQGKLGGHNIGSGMFREVDGDGDLEGYTGQEQVYRQGHDATQALPEHQHESSGGSIYPSSSYPVQNYEQQSEQQYGQSANQYDNQDYDAAPPGMPNAAPHYTEYGAPQGPLPSNEQGYGEYRGGYQSNYPGNY